MASIDAGCCSLADVKCDTKASTGCGGCAAMLKNLVDDELAARGVTVDKSICEHFPIPARSFITWPGSVR